MHNFLKIKSLKIINRDLFRANKLFKKIKVISNDLKVEVVSSKDNYSLSEIDIIINATSLGLKENDTFGIDFSMAGKNKLFFDVIYNPFKTDFSEAGSKQGNIIENGLNMFLFQAQKAFSIWHNVEPKIDQDVIKFLES